MNTVKFQPEEHRLLVRMLQVLRFLASRRPEPTDWNGAFVEGLLHRIPQILWCDLPAASICIEGHWVVKGESEVKR